jgi:hypothetical protein
MTETCKNCRFWTENPVDPKTWVPGQPKFGICRGGPPTNILVSAQGGIQLMATHPTLPEDWQACGMFQEKSPTEPAQSLLLVS